MKERGTRIDWLPDEKMYRIIVFGNSTAGEESQEIKVCLEDLQGIQRKIFNAFAPDPDVEKYYEEPYIPI